MDVSSGLVYNNAQNHLVALRLDQVDAQINILDVSAMVTLRQTFRNPDGKATGRCKYVFPIPARASICGFQVTFEDGRTVTGIAKDKDLAKIEYEAALQQNQQAALLEMATSDLFTISVGSIPAKQKVNTKLVFIQSLMNNNNIDEVRLQLPFYIAARYRAPPTGVSGAESVPTSCRVRIRTDIQTSGPIQNIESPSHPAMSIRSHSSRHGKESRRRKIVKYNSATYLDRDFILVIHAHDAGSPHCFAEMRYESKRKDACTLALQLVLTPKLEIPSHPQEYIFVIDRSGSMEGQPIETAKKTLAILLSLLPQNGSKFGIIAFDHALNILWEKSREYSESTRDEAVQFVSNLTAGGGTQIFNATMAALDMVDGTVPTSIFILTDGQVGDDLVQESCRFVSEKVKAAAPGCPLRVFTLGIGNAVSSAFCDNVAYAGNGTSEYASIPESIIPKCARLLQAGRTPTLKTVTIDWGVPPIPASPFLQPGAVPSGDAVVRLEPPAPIQQSPPDIFNLHSGTRISIFAILALSSPKAPKEVTMRMTLDEGAEQTVTVPVRGVQLETPKPSLPMVHVLAAAHLIRDHEANKAPLPRVLGGIPTSDHLIRRAAIIRLGEKYQLASTYTSFVAIDSESYSRKEGRRSTDSRRSSRTRTEASTRVSTLASTQASTRVSSSTQASTRVSSSTRASTRASAQASSQASGASTAYNSPRSPNVITTVLGYFADMLSSPESEAQERSPRADRYPPGAYPGSDTGTGASSRAHTNRRNSRRRSTDSYSTMSSLVSTSSEGDYSPPPSDDEAGSDQEPIARSPSPQVRAGQQNQSGGASTSLPAPPPLAEDITNLMLSQRFDGSFDEQAVAGLMTEEAYVASRTLVEDDKVRSTMIAIAYMKRRMGLGQRELYEVLITKAMAFLKESYGGNQKFVEDIMADLAKLF